MVIPCDGVILLLFVVVVVTSPPGVDGICVVLFVVAITKLVVGLFAPDNGAKGSGSLAACLNSIVKCNTDTCGDIVAD